MSPLAKFRLINKVEGYSFIILIFIAMPLKYWLGYPIATKIAGMTHGILFIWFIYQLFDSKKDVPFSNKESLIFFILSLIPFGSFYTEKVCREKEQLVPCATKA